MVFWGGFWGGGVVLFLFFKYGIDLYLQYFCYNQAKFDFFLILCSCSVIEYKMERVNSSRPSRANGYALLV